MIIWGLEKPLSHAESARCVRFLMRSVTFPIPTLFLPLLGETTFYRRSAAFYMRKDGA